MVRPRPDDLAELAGLAALTRLQLDRDEAETARLAARAAALQDRIAALDSLAARAFEAGPGAMARQMMGTDALWHSRLGLDRQRLMAELAALRVRQDSQAARHRQSFGRHEAVGALSETLHQASRHHGRKQAEARIAEALLIHPPPGTVP